MSENLPANSSFPSPHRLQDLGWRNGEVYLAPDTKLERQRVAIRGPRFKDSKVVSLASCL